MYHSEGPTTDTYFKHSLQEHATPRVNFRENETWYISYADVDLYISSILYCILYSSVGATNVSDH